MQESPSLYSRPFYRVKDKRERLLLSCFNVVERGSKVILVRKHMFIE